MNESEAGFEPKLTPGKYHLLPELVKVGGGGSEMVEAEEQEICFIVCKNGILNFDCTTEINMEDLLQGIGESDLKDFQLLAEDGSLVDLVITPKLKNEKIYYVSSSSDASPMVGDDLIRFPSIKHFYGGLTLNRPMAFMAPYLIAVLRALSILTHAGDQTSLKSTRHDHTKRHNLVSTSTLSTAAFQVAYRINDVAKALHLITNKIANDKVDCIEIENEFEDNSDASGVADGQFISEFVIDFPGCNLDPVLKLLKKALFESEELLELVVESMKEKHSSDIKTVETALIMEKGRHQRREQKITFENIVDEVSDPDSVNISKR